MKKLGIINSHIASILSTLGHTDTIVICDAGLPIANAKAIIRIGEITSYANIILQSGVLF